MFKIGEFSKLAQVSVRMLRYYDEHGLLTPAQIDPYTGYRLYAAAQLSDLNRIVFLRDLGFTVEEISLALDSWSDEALASLLAQKRAQIEQEIAERQRRLATIAQAGQDIRQHTMDIHYNVTLKAIPSQLVLSLRCTVPDYYAEGALWKRMAAFAAEHRITLSPDTFTIYHDTDHRDRDVDIELCAPVNQAGEDRDGFIFRRTEPVPSMASTMIRGPFSRIAGAYRAFAGWLESHSQYTMRGQSRQIVHRGPWNEPSPEQYLIELQIPLDSHTV